MCDTTGAVDSFVVVCLTLAIRNPAGTVTVQSSSVDHFTCRGRSRRTASASSSAYRQVTHRADTTTRNGIVPLTR
ncbi:hypothetical protein HBB16_09985 [Pseudonocardia sp. MCCB 268]|nr:hypothetical protein [Pseudonocardia cytotoxica]